MSSGRMGPGNFGFGSELGRRGFLKLLGVGLAAAGALVIEACSAGVPQQAVTQEAETPRRGGTLTVQLTADPESLDRSATHSHLFALGR